MPMPYFAVGFLIVFASVFLWLVAKGLRIGVTGGLGWSVARAHQPILYWLCIGAWTFNALASLLFLGALVIVASTT